MIDRRQEVMEVITATKSLPAMPAIIGRLNAMAASRNSSIQEMAHLVSSDQVLSARILRLVNSPSYGCYRVATISNAMILLGVDVIKCLALSASLFDMMEKNLLGLWEHSLGTGVAANLIAHRLQLPESEEISTAGLLHDIGKVILKIKFDKEYQEVHRLVDEEGISWREAEVRVMGVDHAEIGGVLAKTWYLPEKLREPIMCHHDVACSDAHRIKTATVHLADVLIKAWGFGSSGDDQVPQIQPLAWQVLDMTMHKLEEIINELEDRLAEAKNFSMGPG